MKKISLIGVLLFFVFTAYAQTQWTLRACLEYAVNHNIAVKQLELNKKGAEVNLNSSQMSRLPNLNAGASQNWNFGRGETGSGLYENQTQSNASFNISSSIPLFTGFRISNEIARDRLNVQAATLNLNKAKEDLSLNIASLYLQVLFNKELLHVAEEQQTLSKTQVERTQSLVEAGKVPESQLSDMRAQAANDDVSVIQALNNMKLALLDLAQSLELEEINGFDIVEPNFDDFLMSELYSPTAIYENALKTKPAIKMHETQVESAEKALKIAQAGYLPTLNLNLGYGTNYFYSYDFPLNRPLGDQLKNNSGEYIGLNLNIPIFNRFSVKNQVRSAQLNIENNRFELENAKKVLFKEIQTAYLNATAAQEKYKASEIAVSASTVSFSMATDKYAAGKSTVFEMNEARTKWIQSRSNTIQAKYDFIFRSKILDFYLGKEIAL
ncbi:MAG: TolC family protein [Prevotellaceae bacterium]|jgi:outer membrane protein|nr:TolC family protein [Prevotellaceae bacterium]